jgi:branched-chain amino acid aminotransferase
VTQINIPLLDPQSLLQNLRNHKNPSWPQYHAHFSTWIGGITQDPALMLLPMDDHMVHRGDGVFEAIKAVDRKVFLMSEHLQRLSRSAEAVGISLPFELSQIQDIILQTLRVANQPQALIRLFVSRGPGGYTTNPYESMGSQLYVTITDLRSPKPELYENGVHVGRSQIPVKDSWMAQVKSCNYLPNVMMKKEAVDRKLDFTIAFDRDQFLAESSTENIALLDASGVLVHPDFQNILRGTTLVKAFELAAQAGMPTSRRNISESDLRNAREAFMIGTTLDVMPVTRYEGQNIGSGEVGPRARELRKLLIQDFGRGIAY